MEMEFLGQLARHSKLEKIRNSYNRKRWMLRILWGIRKWTGMDLWEECKREGYPKGCWNGVHLGEKNRGRP